MSNVLFMDVAFANVGWVILKPEGGDYKFVACGCIKTSKSAKARKLRVATDDMRRCKEIADKIIELIDTENIAAVASEDPSGGAKSARAARCLGMATAIIGTLEAVIDKPFLHVTPTEVKIALCEKKSASKEDMMKAAKMKFSEFDDIPKTRFEHIADAVGVALAVKDDPVIRMLRRI